MTCSTQRHRLAVLRSFPTRLPRDRLFKRQVRDRLTKPLVLLLETLQPLHLVALRATELLAPAIVGERRHHDRPDSHGNRTSLGRRTSTCRSSATIFSGLCFFCAIAPSSKGSKAYLMETIFQGADHSFLAKNDASAARAGCQRSARQSVIAMRLIRMRSAAALLRGPKLRQKITEDVAEA